MQRLVPLDALARVEFGARIGETLVESQTLTPEQVSQAVDLLQVVHIAQIVLLSVELPENGENRSPVQVTK